MLDSIFFFRLLEDKTKVSALVIYLVIYIMDEYECFSKNSDKVIKYILETFEIEEYEFNHTLNLITYYFYRVHRYHCECGSVVRWDNTTHFLTTKHNKYVRDETFKILNNFIIPDLCELILNMVFDKM